MMLNMLLVLLMMMVIISRMMAAIEAVAAADAVAAASIFLVPLERVQDDLVIVATVVVAWRAPKVASRPVSTAAVVSVTTVQLESSVVESNAFGVVIVEFVLVCESHPHVTGLLQMVADLQDRLRKLVGRFVTPPTH